MKPKIITISINAYNDLPYAVGVDAEIDRLERLGADIKTQNYSEITDASFARLQEAQKKLLQRPLPEY